jgi:hypothetical protein
MELNDLTLMMMERGRNLFEAKMDKEIQSELNDCIKDRLKWLKDEFKNKVVVAEIKDCDYLAAARIFNACIKTARDLDMQTKEDIKNSAIINYFLIPIGHETSRIKTDEQNKVTQELSQEIDENNPEANMNYCNASDKEGRQFECEIIDLIDGATISELTIEGKRARGLLPADFDETVDDESKYNMELNSKSCAAVETNEYGEVVCIYCPNEDCNSVNLVMEMSKGVCLDCNMEFDVPLSLGDNLNDLDEMADEGIDNTIVLANSGKFNRLTGQKKDRGIIGID